MMFDVELNTNGSPLNWLTSRALGLWRLALVAGSNFHNQVTIFFHVGA